MNIAAAERDVKFGLAAYCGFGRSPVSDLPGILDDHLKAAQPAG